MKPLESLPRPGLGSLLRIAIPSAIFAILTNGFRVVDQYFIGTVSTAAQAAVGSSTFVIIVFYAFCELLAAGAGPLIARATGAGDVEARRAVLGAGVHGALGLTLLLTATGVLAAPLIASSLGLSGQAATECTLYLTALSWTALPLVFTPLVDQAFISMGNARVPMILHAVSLALNIALTPILIHTAGLGIVGAALASNLSRAVTTGLGLWIVIRMTGMRTSHVRPTELGRVLRVGTPAALGVASFALVYWAMLRTSISPLGAHVNAALGIGFSALEGVAWPAFHGLSLGVASLIGRYLGAGRVDLAWSTVRLALPLSTVLGVAATLLFWLAGHWLTGLFTDDPAVHRAAAEYAMILAASQLFVAWESLAEGVLNGAGDTRTAFLCSLPLNLLRVPLAWYFAFPLHMGAAGIWWAINITTYGKTLAKAYATMRGRWTSLDI